MLRRRNGVLLGGLLVGLLAGTAWLISLYQDSHRQLPDAPNVYLFLMTAPNTDPEVFRPWDQQYFRLGNASKVHRQVEWFTIYHGKEVLSRQGGDFFLYDCLTGSSRLVAQQDPDLVEALLVYPMDGTDELVYLSHDTLWSRKRGTKPVQIASNVQAIDCADGRFLGVLYKDGRLEIQDGRTHSRQQVYKYSDGKQGEDGFAMGEGKMAFITPKALTIADMHITHIVRRGAGPGIGICWLNKTTVLVECLDRFSGNTDIVAYDITSGQSTYLRRIVGILGPLHAAMLPSPQPAGLIMTKRL